MMSLTPDNYLEEEEEPEEGQVLGFLSLGVGRGTLGIPHHVAEGHLHGGLHLGQAL